MRRAERDRGGEVVDHLGDDAREIDRVDARQRDAVAEGRMIEHPLHDRLAIVEGPVDRDRVHVRVFGGGHHAALHVRDAAVRKQHDQIDLSAAAKSLDGGAAGVARGRDRDGGALAAARQRMVHQAREELHRQVLEGERRPVMELEHEGVGAKLHQRRDRRMVERAVGLVSHARQVRVGDRSAVLERRRSPRARRELHVRLAQQRLLAQDRVHVRAKRGVLRVDRKDGARPVPVLALRRDLADRHAGDADVGLLRERRGLREVGVHLVQPRLQRRGAAEGDPQEQQDPEARQREERHQGELPGAGGLLLH